MIENGERRRVAVDPRTAGVVDIPEHAPEMWCWLAQLHFNLLAGRGGRVVNGVGGLLMGVLCASGLFICWQGRAQWSRGLSIDWRARWKKINGDLHGATGFWCVTFLLLLSVTGAYFSWPPVYRDLVSAVFPLNATAPPREAPRGERRASLSEIAASARSAAPGRHLSHLIFGEKPEQPVRAVLSGAAARGHQSFDRDTVYVDPFRARMMQANLAAGRTIGDKIVTAIVSIHFGNFAGKWSKALWLVLGLGPVVLFVTGYLMWWNRVVARRWADWRSEDHNRSPHGSRTVEAEVID